MNYKLSWIKNTTGSFRADLVVRYDNNTKLVTASRNFTLVDPPVYVPGSGGGGGGGGGGGVPPGDPYCKTSIRELRDGYLHADIPTNIMFTTPFIGIYEIEITPVENLGPTDFKVVKCISEITGTSQTPGIAYIFNDIWASARELSLNDSIKTITYRFKVEKNWLLENNMAENSMMLSRWDGEKWISLLTHVLSRDEKNVYYEATTNAIGFFAITTVSIQLSPHVFQVIPTDDTTLTPEPTGTTIPPVVEPEAFPWVDVFSALTILGIISYLILHFMRKPK